MDNNFNKENKKCDSYEIALSMALEEFSARHPRKLLPEWFSKCITVSGTRNQNKNWLISITVVPRQSLKPNQHWEVINGKRTLVSVNPISGERKIVICRASKEIEVLFEAEVDLDNNTATIITDTDLNLLDGTKYEVCDC